MKHRHEENIITTLFIILEPLKFKKPKNCDNIRGNKIPKRLREVK